MPSSSCWTFNIQCRNWNVNMWKLFLTRWAWLCEVHLNCWCHQGIKVCIILIGRVWSIINPINSQFRVASRPPVDSGICVTVETSNFYFILHPARHLGFVLLDSDLITGLYLLSVMHSTTIYSLTVIASMLCSSFN